MTEVAAPSGPVDRRPPRTRRPVLVPTWVAKTVMAVTGLIFTAFVVRLLGLFDLTQVVDRPVIDRSERDLQGASEVGDGIFHGDL